MSQNITSSEDDLIGLDEALVKLSEEDEVRAEVVKLRYFAGLTLEQAAEMMDVSCRTADRYWAYARAWLYNEMRDARGSSCC